MESVPADLHAKYQKLAAEYSKQRAQVSVLKKAIVDEQGKYADLKDVLKERDQSLRKLEQEMDSLNFRNQQLSKRVTVLQDELDLLQIKGKKGKQRNSELSSQVALTNNVIGEELQNKITENARLCAMMDDNERQHNVVVKEQQEKLEKLEREVLKYQQTQNTVEEKHKAVIEKLQSHKAMLEVQLQSQEKEVKEARSQVSDLQQQLHHMEEDLGHQLQITSKIIQDRLPFIDTKQRELNVLNVPTHDRQHQVRCKEIICQVGGYLKELVSGMLNFHTYTDQRLYIFPYEGIDSMTKVNGRFSQHLKQNAKYLRPMEQAFQTFQDSLQNDVFITLETVVGLQGFSQKLNAYVAYLQKLLPYQLLSIEEECALSTCNEALEAKNMQLHGCISKLTAVFSKVGTYISILATQSQTTCQHPHACQKRFLAHVVESLAELHEAVKELSKTYNAKVTVEHQMPTATEKLKITNECVLSSFISLITCTSKLSGLMLDSLEDLSKVTGYKTRGSSVSMAASEQGLKTHPAVMGFGRRAAEYMELLDQDEPLTVQYEEALKNAEVLESSTESSENLAKQLATSQEKISKLEQAKEHWMLEFQLLQIKYEKETQKMKELEEKFQTLSAASTPQTEEARTPISHLKSEPQTPESSAEIIAPADDSCVITSLLGKLEGPVESDADVGSREQEIKDYFTTRISELVADMQAADSKALTLQTECISLHKRLQLAEEAKASIENNLEDTQETLAKLKEELQTTTLNYESQLSMMSEHLANMNDKLTTQTDEIGELKYQLSSKGTRKGKQNKK